MILNNKKHSTCSIILYLRLLDYVKPYLYLLSLSVLGSIIVAVTDPIIAALIKPLLDGSFISKDQHHITIVPLLLVGIFIIRGISDFTSTISMNWISQKVIMDLRSIVFTHLLNLPSSYFDNHPTNTLISRLTYDVNQVMNTTTQVVITIIRDGIAIIGLLLWMLYLNWKLSFIAIMVAPSTYFITIIISRRLRLLSSNLQDIMSELGYIISEILNSHKVVKIFGGQQYEIRRFNIVNNRVRQINLKISVTSEGSSPLVQTFAISTLGIMVYLASQSSDQITVGSFVSLFGAMAMLLNPIKRLTKINEQLQKGLSGAATIFNLLDTLPETDDGILHIGRANGYVNFRLVSYSYENNNSNYAIKNINLEVKPGEIVAIIGASGSGKTTLINLIPRFYDYKSGLITLDNIPIKKLKLKELRANIAYVGQDLTFFNDTVAANIAYGANFRASQKELIKAAEDSNAIDFILALPNGFQTLIGDNGLKLSGGQRQRLALARAIIKNAPILILDEVTSSLDTKSEAKIQESINNIRKNHTTFIISHKLSTIEKADIILILNQGKIVEVGKHQELIKHSSSYISLYQNFYSDKNNL